MHNFQTCKYKKHALAEPDMSELNESSSSSSKSLSSSTAASIIITEFQWHILRIEIITRSDDDVVIIDEVIVVGGADVTSARRYVWQGHPVVGRLSPTELGLPLLSAPQRASWSRTSLAWTIQTVAKSLYGIAKHVWTEVCEVQS